MIKFCNHLFVEGFGGMCDAVVCCERGLDKYPEAVAAQLLAAKAQGRVIGERHPQYEAYASKARAVRLARETSE